MKQFIQSGWPDDISSIPPELILDVVYWTFRETLTVINDIIFKDNKILVPESLRQDMLRHIHYDHMGIEKCKLRAREHFFWLAMAK